MNDPSMGETQIARLRRELDETFHAGDAPKLSRAEAESVVLHVESLERALSARGETLRGALQELRVRYHAAGRRPEECYEMRLIDDALAASQEEKSG